MQNYKGNSHKSRDEQKASPQDKKIEKVITGSAKTRKKSGMRKFSDVFISEDAGNVKSYIFMDVLLPAAKKLISDVVTNGIDMLLYGEAGRSRKRSGTSKVSYSSYYDRDDRRRERRSYSSRNSFDCSVLEMMVALAIRCEEQIMSDPNIGDRTGRWFRDMLHSLDLLFMSDSKFDKHYADDVIFDFLDRNYEKNGKGGLFTVDNGRDLRSVEIWYQMCCYLNEIL